MLLRCEMLLANNYASYMLLFNNWECSCLVVLISQFIFAVTFFTPSFDSLSWQTLDDRQRYAKSVLMHKILNDHTAPGPRNSFVRRNVNQTNYHLHLCNTATDLTLSKLKREFLVSSSFKFSGTMLWNQISKEAKLTESISLFKKLIRSWLGLANLCILIVANYLWLPV